MCLALADESLDIGCQLLSFQARVRFADDGPPRARPYPTIVGQLGLELHTQNECHQLILIILLYQ